MINETEPDGAGMLGKGVDTQSPENAIWLPAESIETKGGFGSYFLEY